MARFEKVCTKMIYEKVNVSVINFSSLHKDIPETRPFCEIFHGFHNFTHFCYLEAKKPPPIKCSSGHFWKQTF